MEFSLCTDVSDEVVYNVFAGGYSDYFFEFNLEFEEFVKRFLGYEATRNYSYVAYEQGEPIGMMLGGIQIFNGIKTMRCGGYAVLPEHRSKGVGKALFEKHYTLAKENRCKQLYLEVLKQNHDAIRLYEKLGYNPVHDYRLYKNDSITFSRRVDATIIEVELGVITTIRENLSDLYLYWQGEMFTMVHFDDVKHYGIEENGETIAVLSLKDNGQIQFIWVEKEYRLRGYGETLLAHGLEKLDLTKASAVASNNLVYEGFLRKLGFEVAIEQFEMMQIIN